MTLRVLAAKPGIGVLSMRAGLASEWPVDVPSTAWSGRSWPGTNSEQEQADD
jgi:hypothetical protein